MSAFDFINDSQPKNNQTSNNKTRRKKAHAVKSAQPVTSSSSSTLSLSNKDTASGSKSVPKSCFSFIDQNNGNQPVSNVAKQKPLQFSSSFIMEDFIDGNEDGYRPKTKKDKNTRNKYFSLVDDYTATFADKQQNISSNADKDRLFQSMSDNLVLSRHHQEQPYSSPPMAKSAFDFINHAPLTRNSNYTSPSLLDDETEIPVMSKSIIKPDKEAQLLQASTRWQKIQKKKSEQMERIKSHYEDQIKYQNMIHEIKDKIEIMESKKQQALDSEDFEAAHTCAVRKEKMERDHWELSSRNFQEQARKEWQRLMSMLHQESQAAQHMADCCQKVKQERQRLIATFVADKERSHEETIKHTEQQRAAIEGEKSEIAFDLGMWHQNQADLDDLMEEAVQEEMERKKTLESTSATIELTIKELRQKLKQLESDQATVKKELKDVETTIHTKLAVFSQTVDQCRIEKTTIEARQKDVRHKLVLLDEQDAKIERDMENQQATQQLNKQELDLLTTQWEQAKERAQASKAEQSVLGDLLNLLNEKRDQIVAQHKAAIRKPRESISRKSQEIKSIQERLYQCEQVCVDLEQDTIKVASQLKSLDKLKDLAIENGQFEKAGALTLKARAAQSVLAKLKETRQDPQQEITIVADQLKNAKDDIGILEQDLVLMENNHKTDLELVLEKLKQQLTERLEDTLLEKYETIITMIECEMKSIDLQLSDIQTV